MKVGFNFLSVALVALLGGAITVSSQNFVKKSQVLLLDEAKIVVIGKVEKFGGLPSTALSNDVSICQTIRVQVIQVLKGNLKEKEILLNVGFVVSGRAGLAGALDLDENYVFLLNEQDRLGECRYQDIKTLETLSAAEPNSRMPAYKIEFESIFKATDEELGAVKKALKGQSRR